MRLHGDRQADRRLWPSASRPAAVRPPRGWQAGTRKHPFASRGQPCRLIATKKQREGGIPRRRATAIGSDGRREPREARVPSRDGPGHAPSSTRGAAGRLSSSTVKDVAIGAIARPLTGRGKCHRRSSLGPRVVMASAMAREGGLPGRTRSIHWLRATSAGRGFRSQHARYAQARFDRGHPPSRRWMRLADRRAGLGRRRQRQRRR
jgi:hypothetical protein